MTPSHLHEKLIEACKNGDIEKVKYYLDVGAEPDFNIKRQLNALDIAIDIDNHQIIKLLLEHGATVKELILQKAIEKDQNYLAILIPDFTACKDQSLLMGVLQAAIKIGSVNLAKQAIEQGAKPEALFLSTIRDLNNPQVLQILIENGFDIHTQKNKIVTEWMGSSIIGSWRNSRPPKEHLLAFISNYYLDKPQEIAKFATLPDKTLLFRMGLDSHNFTIMKFAFMIGANKNEALNSILYRYYAKDQKDTQSKSIDREVIEFILNSDIEFEKITISNGVFFKYTELLDSLSTAHDLEYGYEMAYNYDNDDLCEYFINRGVSSKAQNLAKMKVSAIKGDIKTLRNVLNNGADLKMLDTEVLVEIINKNQLKTLKYLYDSGISFDSSLNQYLNQAMSYHEAYESISYLIEIGFDITNIKNLPRAYQKKYPAIADMWEKRFRNIFEYTIYLAKEVHPRVEGKEKEKILERIAELSCLPYVMKRSKEKSLGN